MPSQSNFNQQLNFQCENASYQQNKLQMLMPNNVSFMDSFDHRIPINNSFSSYAISANNANMDYDDDDTQGI
jgi:hypothetical protein